MKRRWRIALAAAGLSAAAVLAPVTYIEGTCRDPLPGLAAGYKSLLPAVERRPEARTLLTYPEWHIVYAADSLGRWLKAGQRPSGYGYGGDVASFWTSYCAVNRATLGSPAAGDAKVMLYTIGISFTAEMMVKAAWEQSIGRVAEALSGWTSADDAYAAGVQVRYGEFMHQTPWYAFPFGAAFTGLWRTDEPQLFVRHWERRLALSAEYGVKAGYAGLIGWASGATLGRDELTMRLVMRGDPAAIAALDRRLKPFRAGQGLTVVEVPRYAEFTDILRRLPADVGVVEIAGNDDIFLTALVPADTAFPGHPLIAMPLADRPGWRRVGVTVNVSEMLATMATIQRGGGRVEHVYDY